jgi:co-chaperonin GroES (HSP10)
MKLTHLPQAYGKNIIVKLDEPETTSEGGIIVTEKLSNFSTGEVMSVAEAYCPDMLCDDEQDLLPCLIEVGETVMFVSNGFYSFEFEGDKYVVLRYSEVLATL